MPGSPESAAGELGCDPAEAGPWWKRKCRSRPVAIIDKDEVVTYDEHTKLHQFILDHGNRLYDNNLSPHTDEGRGAFVGYAGTAAKHFAGKSIFWGIWNEPNIGVFWKPKPNAEDYSAMALAAISAVRQADPNAFIMGPASSSVTPPAACSTAAPSSPSTADCPTRGLGRVESVTQKLALRCTLLASREPRGEILGQIILRTRIERA
jgi:hypothetical protein